MFLQVPDYPLSYPKVSHTRNMLFSAYPEEQRDLRWVTITLTVIATLLLVWRIINTTTNRGWLGVEDVLVIIANVTIHV